MPKRRASLLFTFLSENSLYFGVDEIISFQKVVGNLDKVQLLTWVGNTRDLWTTISRVLENICIFLELYVIISYHLYCLNSLHIFLSSYYS